MNFSIYLCISVTTSNLSLKRGCQLKWCCVRFCTKNSVLITSCSFMPQSTSRLISEPNANWMLSSKNMLFSTDATRCRSKLSRLLTNFRIMPPGRLMLLFVPHELINSSLSSFSNLTLLFEFARFTFTFTFVCSSLILILDSITLWWFYPTNSVLSLFLLLRLISYKLLLFFISASPVMVVPFWLVF